MLRFTWRVITLTILLVVGLVAHAGTMHLVRWVLLPDGRPAEGASVLVRTFQYDEHTNSNNPAPTLLREYRFITDAEGCVNIIFPTTYPKERRVDSISGYLLFEKSGYAPAIAEIRDLSAEITVMLEPAYTATGRVMSADNHPVPHATVTLHMIAKPFNQEVTVLNNAAKGIVTPVFTTVTDDQGVFKLSGPAAQYRPIRAYVSASATINGQILVGGTSQITFLAHRVIPPGTFHSGVAALLLPGDWGNPSAAVVITVFPALQGQGTVKDAFSGKPLSGAVVTATGEPAWQFGCVPSVTTDNSGHYTLQGVPASISKLLVGATAKNYAPARAKATELHVGTADTPATFSETPLAISLRPLTTVTGTVIDKVSNQHPVAPYNLKVYYDDGAGDVPFRMTNDGYTQWYSPKAKFRVIVPAGEIRLNGYIACGSGGGVLDLSIPRTGLTNVRLKVWRADGIFIRVVPNGVAVNNIDLCATMSDKPGIRMMSSGGECSYWYFHFAKGANVNIQVLRITENPYQEQPISPWINFTVKQNSQDWPQVITLNKPVTPNQK